MSGNNGRALATVGQSDWQLMMEQAKVLVPTNFLPDAIKSPEQAVAIMLKGRELGIPAMYALQNINIISSKPTANAECIRSLIYRDHGDDALMFIVANETVATLRYKRRGWKDYQEFSYTIEDARRAGLLDGKNAHSWRKFPGEMLRARCTSSVGRMAFSDSAGGLYTPEEMGAVVNEAGEIVSVRASDPPAYQPEPPRQHEHIAEGEYHDVEPDPDPVMTDAAVQKLVTSAKKYQLSWAEVITQSKKAYGQPPHGLRTSQGRELWTWMAANRKDVPQGQTQAPQQAFPVDDDEPSPADIQRMREENEDLMPTDEQIAAIER